MASRLEEKPKFWSEHKSISVYLTNAQFEKLQKISKKARRKPNNMIQIMIEDYKQ